MAFTLPKTKPLKIGHAKGKLLLMEELLHQPTCMKPCKSWDIYYINWCRISAINSTIPTIHFAGANHVSFRGHFKDPCICILISVQVTNLSPAPNRQVFLSIPHHQRFRQHAAVRGAHGCCGFC